MRKVNGPFIVAAAALSAGCQSFQHARDIEQSALVEMDAARQQWHKHSAPRRAAQTVQYAAQQWIFPTPLRRRKRLRSAVNSILSVQNPFLCPNSVNSSPVNAG